jgi:hypothetical protein
LSIFLDDESIFIDKNGNPISRVQVQPTYNKFLAYCKNSGYSNYNMTKKEFSKRMENLGYNKTGKSTHGNYYFENNTNQQ